LFAHVRKWNALTPTMQWNLQSMAVSRIKVHIGRRCSFGVNICFRRVRLPCSCRVAPCATVSSAGVSPHDGARGSLAKPSSEQDGKQAEDVDIPPEVADLFETLRKEAIKRLDEFAPIHLFSLCWAYSTARLLDDDLRDRIVAAAFRLGKARDFETQEKNSRQVSKEPLPEAMEQTPEQQSEHHIVDEPTVIDEGDHWMAFYKPPMWQVNVDSKEAAKAAAAVPFDDGDEGEAEDLTGDEFQRRPKMSVWLRRNYAAKFPICGDAIEAFGLMHRLDAQTSGLLMCAKSYVGAYWLRLQWCSYLVDKEYVCLVHGWVDQSIREVNKRIRIEKRKAPNSRKTVSTHCSVGASGKPSYTELITLAHLVRPATGVEATADERYSLVVVKLHTGRTHQIRVHMQSLGHPLVCDEKYADAHLVADRSWCPRNFLHTFLLGFEDVPKEGAVVEAASSSGGSSSGSSGCSMGSTRNKGSNEDCNSSRYVKLLCPLPPDLQSTLSQLKPIDDASAKHCSDWLSQKRDQLRSFEEYTAAVTV